MSSITCYSCRQICYTFGYAILSDVDGKILTAKIVFRDEATFCLSWHINCFILEFWGNNNPRAVIEFAGDCLK